jgi:uncharacterized membrane protein
MRLTKERHGPDGTRERGLIAKAAWRVIPPLLGALAGGAVVAASPAPKAEMPAEKVDVAAEFRKAVDQAPEEARKKDAETIIASVAIYSLLAAWIYRKEIGALLNRGRDKQSKPQQ